MSDFSTLRAHHVVGFGGIGQRDANESHYQNTCMFSVLITVLTVLLVHYRAIVVSLTALRRLEELKEPQGDTGEPTLRPGGKMKGRGWTEEYFLSFVVRDYVRHPKCSGCIITCILLLHLYKVYLLSLCVWLHNAGEKGRPVRWGGGGGSLRPPHRRIFRFIAFIHACLVCSPVCFLLWLLTLLFKKRGS